MNQYTPMRKFEDPILNKTASKQEYEDLIDYAYDLGIRNCFVQE
jgi:putative pyruvate formate lyase activating enzyme